MNIKIAKKTKTIKKYLDLYAFPFKMKFMRKDKDSWKNFTIPSNKKKGNISGNIDKILYGNLSN